MNGNAVVHRLDVGGERVEFVERGKGEPLLLVHAGVFDAWFAPLAGDATVRDFRVLETRRVGYDTTAPPPGQHLTIADHARHCAAVLDSLQIRRAHVLGHSSGSLICLQLAADRPELVQSLVLVEPAIAPALAPPTEAAGIGESYRAMAALARESTDLRPLFDSFMRQVCAEDYRDVLLAALGPEGLQRAERDCGFFFRDEVPAVQHWTFDQAVGSRVTQPVLFVQGGDSPPMVHAISAHLAAMLAADTETTTVPGTDHLLPLRDPATLGRLAATFISRHQITTSV
ncbi:alpha/beta fold hydrolase [Tenggerimyces flavus]|uniref:Alpha/beta fold hydrolase n=1 Tax=Tenggerimyces flavus TaxID=1708749 RepID=A0ABV7YHQ4_9ACTN|nr:alpha/beta hydrolase [Tenggerimyces flavus]MBM7784361.1 pimeloyl-ACP methyl ester carboxylesterase [Tenggerimyces flavus]